MLDTKDKLELLKCFIKTLDVKDYSTVREFNEAVLKYTDNMVELINDSNRTSWLVLDKNSYLLFKNSPVRKNNTWVDSLTKDNGVLLSSKIAAKLKHLDMTVFSEPIQIDMSKYIN